MTSTPESAPLADERLVGARDIALAALQEITPAATIGPAAGYLVEQDGSVSLRFENRLSGYPGWYWTVTVARVEDEEPTVLEAELLPGDGALIAPEWVPWAERLADYRAHQAELAAEADAGADDETEESVEGLDTEGLDPDDDLDEHDLDDEDDDLAPRLHAGDLDGVDIDELDEPVADDTDEDSDADDTADDSDEDASEEE